MGTERQGENFNAESRRLPKLTMAGTLNISVAGQSFQLIGKGDSLQFSFPTIRSAVVVNRQHLPLAPIRTALEFTKWSVTAALGRFPVVRVYPGAARSVKLVSRLARELN